MNNLSYLEEAFDLFRAQFGLEIEELETFSPYDGLRIVSAYCEYEEELSDAEGEIYNARMRLSHRIASARRAVRSLLH